MSPEYYHNRLTYYEANDFLKGLQRRYHSMWETARWQTTFIAKIGGNKSYEAPKFPWEADEKGTGHEYSDEEVDDLKRKAEAWAERMNRRPS